MCDERKKTSVRKASALQMMPGYTTSLELSFLSVMSRSGVMGLSIYLVHREIFCITTSYISVSDRPKTTKLCVVDV